MIGVALAIHVLAVVVWVGGMAFTHFALRPALTETLEPPQRLKVLTAILHRFLSAVTLAVGLIILSGGYLLASTPAYARSPAVHIMLALGVVMAIVFAYIRWRTYPRMREAVAASRFPDAGAAANTIRHLVDVNLALGVIVIVAAVLGR